MSMFAWFKDLDDNLDKKQSSLKSKAAHLAQKTAFLKGGGKPKGVDWLLEHARTWSTLNNIDVFQDMIRLIEVMAWDLSHKGLTPQSNEVDRQQQLSAQDRAIMQCIVKALGGKERDIDVLADALRGSLSRIDHLADIKEDFSQGTINLPKEAFGASVDFEQWNPDKIATDPICQAWINREIKHIKSCWARAEIVLSHCGQNAFAKNWILSWLIRQALISQFKTRLASLEKSLGNQS